MRINLVLIHRPLRRQIHALIRCSRPIPRRRTTSLLPIHKTAIVLADPLIPRLLRNRGGGPAPHASFTEKDAFFLEGRFLPSELLAEVFRGEEEGVWVAGYGYVYCGGDCVCAVFAGFADVD